MTELLKNIWEILKGLGNMYIIWLVGPEGILFDLKSILSLLISAITVIALILRVWWKWSKR